MYVSKNNGIFECFSNQGWHYLRQTRRYGLVGVGVASLEEMCQ